MIFILCLLLLVIAPLLHITLCTLNLYGRVKISIFLITLIGLMSGLVLPVLATYIDLMNLPPGIKCGTPSLGFMYLGILLTMIVIPVSTAVFSVIKHYKQKRCSAAV